jgi:D-serine deaminase-like pyridoxal phosphate-dependent protein
MRIENLDTPALLIDRRILLRNIRRAQEYFTERGITFRPHIKTHKMPPIARLQIEAGAVGLTCAKLGEAEVMVNAGIADLLVAYPIWGASKLRRLLDLAERARITVALDSEEVAMGISQAASGAGAEIGVVVETDTGMGRCGVAPGEPLLALCRRVAELPGLRFRGLMTYQGYVNGSEAERRRALEEESARIDGLLEALVAAGLACEVVSGASTPNLFLSHLLKPVNENRCGTYVFNDRNIVHFGELGWEDCAARVEATVVSTAVPGQVIIDGGSKTFSSDGWVGGAGYGHVVEYPDAVFAKMNEEHGYVKLPPGDQRPRVGERVHVIPNHVCAAINMHDQVWVHENGEVVDCWQVAARGRIR